MIIDVRTAREYISGHIPGAKHIPFWSMVYRYKELKEEKEQLLVLYCEHGPRAWMAKAILASHGFKDVLYLYGHMKAWRKDGLIIENIDE